jgi:hypothetical protein
VEIRKLTSIHAVFWHLWRGKKRSSFFQKHDIAMVSYIIYEKNKRGITDFEKSVVWFLYKKAAPVTLGRLYDNRDCFISVLSV